MAQQPRRFYYILKTGGLRNSSSVQSVPPDCDVNWDGFVETISPIGKKRPSSRKKLLSKMSELASARLKVFSHPHNSKSFVSKILSKRQCAWNLYQWCNIQSTSGKPRSGDTQCASQRRMVSCPNTWPKDCNPEMVRMEVPAIEKNPEWKLRFGACCCCCSHSTFPGCMWRSEKTSSQSIRDQGWS